MSEKTEPKKVRRCRCTLKFETAVKDCLSSAECFKSTSAQLGQAFYGLKDRYNVPANKWAWASGYRDARVDAWYRYNLVFAYVINGALVPCGWDKMTEEQREYCRAGLNTVGGQWWKGKDGLPVAGFPFYVSRDNRLPKDPITGHYPAHEEITGEFTIKANP